jgi:hypothetical protein
LKTAHGNSFEQRFPRALNLGGIATDFSVVSLTSVSLTIRMRDSSDDIGRSGTWDPGLERRVVRGEVERC